MSPKCLSFRADVIEILDLDPVELPAQTVKEFPEGMLFGNMGRRLQN